MRSSRAQKLLVEIAILVAAIGIFPGVAGYAWALGWLPVYGAVCHLNKIYGPAIDPDGYRIYLIGRGCDVDATIRNILAASQFAAGQDKVDADKIIDVYHRKQLAVTGNEFLAVDLVRQKVREFAGTAAGEEPSDQDFISRWVHSYLSYVQSQFRFTAIDGADYMTSLLRIGLIAQLIIALCYLGAVLFAAGYIVHRVIRRSPASWQIAKSNQK